MNKKLSTLFKKPLENFIQTESASGVILAFCALLAMAVANSPLADFYFGLLSTKISFLTVQHWINDGLMTIFFFVVGLEIKREIVSGELSTVKKASLPIAAAIGGMVVPALIYRHFNPSGAGENGWAIPMATDIAFALGVISLFGPRVPLSLKIFLLALAIVDDLGAILVIAFFYTAEIKIVGLAVAGIAAAAAVAARILKLRSYFFYIPLGMAAWTALLYSGVHATIAGVIFGLLTPQLFLDAKKPFDSFSPVDDLIHFLHPWVSFGIMPVFALANAGIRVTGTDISTVAGDAVFSGVTLGLLAGKPLGILLFSGLAVLLGFAKLADGLKWRHLFGVSITAGIGFTMSIFIANLALPPGQILFAKIGILTASFAAAVLGYIALRISLAGSAE